MRDMLNIWLHNTTFGRKVKLVKDRIYLLYLHARAAIFTEKITVVHVKLTALMSFFTLCMVGLMSWFKWTDTHLEHVKWSEILVLLVFIPFYWFGLWCAWKAGFDGEKKSFQH